MGELSKMELNVIEQSGVKTVNLTQSDSEQIIQIVDFMEVVEPYEELKSEYFAGIRIDIESFRLTSRIKSIAESPPPSVAPDTTTSEAQALLIDLYKKYPTKPFEIYIDDRVRLNSGWEKEWVYVGEATLQNRAISYPVPLIPFLSGTEIDLVHPIALACRVPGIGEFDKISVRISWLLRISLIKRSPQKATLSRNLGINIGHSIVQISPLTSNRKILFLQNVGINRVWFAFGIEQTNPYSLINTSLYLDPGGTFSLEPARYDISLPIWAVCEEGKSSRLVGQEFE